ncbi:MAG: thioredoxin [Streptococcus sp.]|nr:thioredoxin [Streptococcus sp.]MBP9623564.1 thioredoxin [Streptococcus sp.]
MGASVFLVRQSSSSTESEYRQAVKAYQTISISELEEKLDRQDDFILYIGRETCPYCRAFVPKLTQAVEETGKTVFYLDSENDPDGKIDLFRQVSGLKTVPSLTYFKSGKLNGLLRKGSQASQDEIKQFLQLLTE